jgi:hypothetical protein
MAGIVLFLWMHILSPDYKIDDTKHNSYEQLELVFEMW